jgi:hypothetical protein
MFLPFVRVIILCVLSALLQILVSYPNPGFRNPYSQFFNLEISILALAWRSAVFIWDAIRIPSQGLRQCPFARPSLSAVPTTKE